MGIDRRGGSIPARTQLDLSETSAAAMPFLVGIAGGGLWTCDPRTDPLREAAYRVLSAGRRGLVPLLDHDDPDVRRAGVWSELR